MFTQWLSAVAIKARLELPHAGFVDQNATVLWSQALICKLDCMSLANLINDVAEPANVCIIKLPLARQTPQQELELDQGT